jgi:hypothetical protein
MKILKLSLFTTLIARTHTSLIPTKRICKDCRYFIGNDLECGKFGDTDIITGKVTYEYARSMRIDEKKCGDKAIHFEKNRFKMVTVPYYFLKDFWPIFLSVSITSFSVVFAHFMSK